MTNEEAIEILRGAIKKPNTKDGYLGQAFDMAIKALERIPSYEAGYNDAKMEIALSGEYERAYERGKADAQAKRDMSCEDCISRAWLKEAIHNFFYGLKHTPTEEDIQAYIDATPSVTPQRDNSVLECVKMREPTPQERESIKQYIDSISVTVPQPKVGEWLKNGDFCKCSNCHSNVLFSAVKYYNYCYRCGAKMV